MQQEQKTVFISYRRSAASFIARAIFLDLRANGYDVFMDVESIDSGQFEQIIFNQIEARAHFLVILTPGTVERYTEANDMMRREIEYAIDKQRNIVPLLVNDFGFGETKAYFTEKLASVPGFNGVKVSHEFWDASMERLRTRFLKQPIYTTIKPAPANEQADVERKIEEVASQPPPTKKQLSAEDYVNKALSLNDNSDQEIAFYKEAIRLNPKYAEAYNNLGYVFFVRKDLDNAIPNFKKAIRFNPRYTTAYINLGLSQAAKGNLDGTLNNYNTVLSYDPENTDVYFNRATVYLAKDNLKAAIADFQKYLDLGGGKRDRDQAEVRHWMRNLQKQLKSKP